MLRNGAQVFHIFVICHTLLWLVSHTGKTLKVGKFGYGLESMSAHRQSLHEKRFWKTGGGCWLVGTERTSHKRTGRDEWLYRRISDSLRMTNGGKQQSHRKGTSHGTLHQQAPIARLQSTLWRRRVWTNQEESSNNHPKQEHEHMNTWTQRSE